MINLRVKTGCLLQVEITEFTYETFIKTRYSLFDSINIR